MAKWITKANDDVLSFCSCEHPLASLPGQLDCPWCGCGYLLTCTFCRKAFTFGSVITIDRTYRNLVEADRQRGGYDTEDNDLTNDAELIEELLSPFSEGTQLVYLDGRYLAADEIDIKFDGLFSRHDLLVPPHQLARAGLAPLDRTVGNKRYWLDRELTEKS